MSLLKTLEMNKVKVERKTTNKNLTIEKMREQINCIITSSYSYVGRTAVDPIISVESVNKISDLIVNIEHKMDKTILPMRFKTISELCSTIQFSRYTCDDIIYVSLLKAYVNYLIENNIPK